MRLLEVNVSPDITHTTAVLRRMVPAAHEALVRDGKAHVPCNAPWRVLLQGCHMQTRCRGGRALSQYCRLGSKKQAQQAMALPTSLSCQSLAPLWMTRRCVIRT